ncbi:unnamed protein product [Citrullus colocynthis]|uniref:Uncharacterized protein n=1 Tax=Citrullus colocynthis TaxID=252529 RepID=A0ABP0XPY3_9ROSI
MSSPYCLPRASRPVIPVAGMVAARYKYRLCSSWSPCTVELRLLSSNRGVVRLAYQLKFSLFQIYAADFIRSSRLLHE